MRLNCISCGNCVSTEVPDTTVIRAYIECPDCLRKDADAQTRLRQAFETLATWLEDDRPEVVEEARRLKDGETS